MARELPSCLPYPVSLFYVLAYRVRRGPGLGGARDVGRSCIEELRQSTAIWTIQFETDHTRWQRHTLLVQDLASPPISLQKLPNAYLFEPYHIALLHLLIRSHASR